MAKKTVVHFNEAGYNGALDRVVKAQKSYQDLLDHFISHLKPLEITVNNIDDLKQLANTHESFIQHKLEQMIPEQSWGPFKLSKRKSVEMLELPDLSGLMELCTNCQEHASEVRYLTLRNSKVTIESDSIDYLRDAYCIFAKTSDQIKLYETHLKLTEVLASFNDQYYKVYGHILSKNMLVSDIVLIEQQRKESSKIIDRVTKLVDGVNEKFGMQVEQTITPESTLKHVELLDPKVSINNFFYQNNPFPYKE